VPSIVTLPNLVFVTFQGAPGVPVYASKSSQISAPVQLPVAAPAPPAAEAPAVPGAPPKPGAPLAPEVAEPPLFAPALGAGELEATSQPNENKELKLSKEKIKPWENRGIVAED